MATSEYALGIDFGGTKVAIAVGDSAGLIHAEDRLSVHDWPTPQSLVRAALQAARKLATPFSVNRIGISTMGITREDQVLLAPNIPGWTSLRLPALVAEAFPEQTINIANDVKAAAMAECRWGALHNVAYGAFLNWGTGIALAFCDHGKVWRGAHGAAGEIAYLRERAEVGYAGGHAPFEEKVGGQAIERVMWERFGVGPSEFFRDLDGVRSRWWDGLLEQVAEGLGNVLVALDVAVMVVGGGLAQQFSHFGPRLESILPTYVPFPPRVVVSPFVDRVGVLGALAVGLDASPPLYDVEPA